MVLCFIRQGDFASLSAFWALRALLAVIFMIAGAWAYLDITSFTLLASCLRVKGFGRKLNSRSEP